MALTALRLKVSTLLPALHVAFELSKNSWKVGFSDGKQVRAVTVPARELGVLEEEIAKAKSKFGLPECVRVVSCFEAGRDGFWLHRCLESWGIENVVIEPASVQVDRRAKRVKTDRLDLEKLLTGLVRYTAGEQDVWRIVRVPSDADEDRRQPTRERERLKREATRHRNRIRSLLMTHGIDMDPSKSGFERALKLVRRWDGSPIPPETTKAIVRELRRLELVEAQCTELEREQLQRVQSGHTETDEKIARLSCVKGIGITSASILATEFFGWRKFRNRRQVGALAGLTGTPYNSGNSNREQGISKAGNRRIRTVMVELAWRWLRWQPKSRLSKWFIEYTGGRAQRRVRRIAIVALARKLLVALWRYLDHGVIPDGAIVKV